MNAQELTLYIAVNLGRMSRWAVEGKKKRIDQFLQETDGYVHMLENTPKSIQFATTFQNFSKKFTVLKKNVQLNESWAEDMLTWANILMHRAKLA